MSLGSGHFGVHARRHAGQCEREVSRVTHADATGRGVGAPSSPSVPFGRSSFEKKRFLGAPSRAVCSGAAQCLGVRRSCTLCSTAAGSNAATQALRCRKVSSSRFRTLGPAKFVARPTQAAGHPSASQKADQQSHEQPPLARSTLADPSTVHTASGAVRHSTRRRRRLEGTRCAVHATVHVGFVTGPWPSASSRTGLWRPVLGRCPEPYSATASSG